MKVAFLNAYDYGGAGTASKRIHRGLRRIGVDSRMIVDHERGDEGTIHGPQSKVRRAYSMARPVIDSLPLSLYGESEGVFSINWLPDDVNRRVARHNPDIVHLNWIGDGFMNVKTVGQFDAPVVWRLADMWAFTGGCHYTDGCERYTESCGSCPRLGSEHKWDLSHWTWRRKHRAFDDADLTIVATTTWLAECTRESSLLGDCRVEVIPNGLDTDVFKPYDSSIARDAFGLNQEDYIVLFGAVDATSNPRKGFDLLSNALNHLPNEINGRDVHLVVFGSSGDSEDSHPNFSVSHTGYLYDDVSLAMLYAGADVMVVPSRYEGFGQTVSEAMACGTPVVAFDTTGPKDIVEHRETGYLADPYNSVDLAEGIEWVLADNRHRKTLSRAARKKAEQKYKLETVARQYRALYESLVKEY